MRVMSVDPGGKTGWCAINIPDHFISTSRTKFDSTHRLVKWCKDNGEMRWGEVSAGPVRTAVELVRTAGHLGCTTVLMESMYLDKPGSRKVRTGDILSPCKVGWAFAGLYEGQKLGTVIWRPPSEMAVITDARLKQWGLWIPNQKDARAALKHLMVYLRGTSV